LTGFYLTMGKYDIVTIIDAPNDEAVANITIGTGSRGSIRTQTLKSFTEDQFRTMVAKMQ
jgi:uncharacterized protein with GYD domain